MTMSTLVSISRAKARLSELVRQSADDDVVLTNRSTPAAVLISADRYDALLGEIEDLKDRLSVHEPSGVTIAANESTAGIPPASKISEEMIRKWVGER
jgi:antitoxin StbD